VHRPFAELNANPQPVALKTVTGDVSAMAAEINQSLQRELASPLKLVKSQSYPLFLVMYDALALLLALATARYWTFYLCRAARLRARGVSSQSAADLILDVLEHMVGLSAWFWRRAR
jgi:hypothetical protein